MAWEIKFSQAFIAHDEQEKPVVASAQSGSAQTKVAGR
jgi:hypothetical protein